MEEITGRMWGGFLQATSLCFLSDTTRRCMLLKSRWSGKICSHQMLIECLCNMQIYLPNAVAVIVEM